jgi:hypothetical protein
MTYRDDAVLGSILDRLQRIYGQLQTLIRSGGFSKGVIAALVRARIGFLDAQKKLYQDLDEVYEVEESA